MKINLNTAYLISILIVIPIILGVIPRWMSFILLLLWVIYSWKAPLPDAVSLFVRNIPFFIALPITASFDNFNSWRVVSAVIFIRWLIIKFKEFVSDPDKKAIFFQIKVQNFGDSIAKIISVPAENRDQTRLNFWHIFWTKHKIGYLIFILFIFAGVSLFTADYLSAGLKRIIYFANLLLIPVVIAHLVKTNRQYLEKLIGDIFLVVSFVISIGFLQLLTTYVMNFAEFMHFWGDIVERNLFGSGWANIAMGANTWFAYNMSSALKLRVFSIFPDSHSFPLFLLSGLPFVLLIFRKYFWAYLYFFLYFFILILTGTRGIWAAFILPISYLLFELCRKSNVQKIFMIFLIFFLSFGAAYLILQKPQFMPTNVGEEEKADIIKRVSSIIDLDETSNFGRIQIWQKTFDSLIRRPLFGVGIGNFPIVLQEEIVAARAGASAHNLYLNIMAEMGILAGLVFLWLFWEILKRAYALWKQVDGPRIKIFAFTSIVSLLWIYAYNLTDAALFDERAFLMFGVLSATILALHKNYSNY